MTNLLELVVLIKNHYLFYALNSLIEPTHKSSLCTLYNCTEYTEYRPLSLVYIVLKTGEGGARRDEALVEARREAR